MRYYSLSTLAFYLSLTLYLLSLCFACFYVEGDQPDWTFFPDKGPGLLLLLIGWIGVLAGEVAWIANPLWMLGVVFFLVANQKNAKSSDTAVSGSVALFFAIAAQSFAMTFLLQSKTLCGNGASAAQIAGYCPGYYFWNLSMLMLIVASLLVMRGHKTITETDAVNE